MLTTEWMTALLIPTVLGYLPFCTKGSWDDLVGVNFILIKESSRRSHNALADFYIYNSTLPTIPANVKKPESKPSQFTDMYEELPS